ncbi:hypothetical protein CR969_00055 [Candidatus Saccharibacteria bacterium]|nr:MAG: hypothetical protein CR969_00055 [Candidatus Saccharibacteria bacterium]
MTNIELTQPDHLNGKTIDNFKTTPITPTTIAGIALESQIIDAISANLPAARDELEKLSEGPDPKSIERTAELIISRLLNSLNKSSNGMINTIENDGINALSIDEPQASLVFVPKDLMADSLRYEKRHQNQELAGKFFLEDLYPDSQGKSFEDIIEQVQSVIEATLIKHSSIIPENVRFYPNAIKLNQLAVTINHIVYQGFDRGVLSDVVALELEARLEVGDPQLPL